MFCINRVRQSLTTFSYIVLQDKDRLSYNPPALFVGILLHQSNSKTEKINKSIKTKKQ